MCCKCCGETIPEFLTIDHINNDGNKHRNYDADGKRKIHGGHHLYRELIKTNFPSGYQVLCYNCNCGRARTKDKICPHKKQKLKQT